MKSRWESLTVVIPRAQVVPLLLQEIKALKEANKLQTEAHTAHVRSLEETYEARFQALEAKYEGRFKALEAKYEALLMQ